MMNDLIGYLGLLVSVSAGNYQNVRFEFLSSPAPLKGKVFSFSVTDSGLIRGPLGHMVTYRAFQEIKQSHPGWHYRIVMESLSAHSLESLFFLARSLSDVRGRPLHVQVVY